MAQLRSNKETLLKLSPYGTGSVAHLHGRGLTLARAAWLVLATLTVALFVAGVPIEFARLSTVCVGASCIETQLSSTEAGELARNGVSIVGYAVYQVALIVVPAVVWCAVGALIFWHRSDERMPLLTALFLVTFGGATFFGTEALLAPHPIWGTLVAFVQYIGDLAFILFLYLFPDGRFVPRWTRWLVVAWAVLQANTYLLHESLFDLPALLDVALLMGLLVVPGVWVQVYRYRHVSGPDQRRQTRLVVFGIVASLAIGTVLLAIFLTFPALGEPGSLSRMVLDGALAFTLLPIPLFIGMAVLRHRLFDVHVVINRTLVYGALTACVVAIYVAVVGYLGALFQTQDSLAISLLGAGLVAVLFAPLRDRLQRVVNRLMYGERDDPYAVLSGLGEHMETAPEPDAVLPNVAQTVAQALKLPHVSIRLKQHTEGEEGFVEVAKYGNKPAADSLVLPLAYRKEEVGELVLSPRVGSEGFARSEVELLEALARQIGVAAHAVRLNEDLQRSRERLVVAREEERRRLRRDLHDGVGPRLAALTLKLESARNKLSGDPKAAALVGELSEQARETIADVRRSVHALRPPSLDELGLFGALREGAAQYSQNGLRVEVEAPQELPLLPAAVEVACYRIASEAMTNVVRHAEASNCVVRIRLDEAAGVLGVEVEDDGQGIREDDEGGVGLHSMRERAEELGGTLIIESQPQGGTRVVAELPCRLTEQTYDNTRHEQEGA